MEEWKDIQNTHYQVSNFGRIRNANDGYVLKQQINDRGYCVVRVKNNDRKKVSLVVHRQVAQTFCANPNNYLEVNHEDGDKTNNQADNLKWCTRGENIKHAWDNNLRSFTNKVRKAVLENLKKANTPEVVARKKYPRSKRTICVETGRIFKSMKAAADFVGAHEQNIQEACASNGRRTSRGYHWEYYKEKDED